MFLRFFISVNEAAKVIHEHAKKKGFYEEFDSYPEQFVVMNKLALIHAEVSEVLEEVRLKEVDYQKVAEELADVMIRTLDVAEFLNLDMNKAISEKVHKNQSREYKHGKKY